MAFNVSDLKKISILYVEDEDFVRSQTADIFKSVFYHTYTAKDGHEALDIFRQNIDDIDIIISDINMPIMNGLELAQAVQEIDKDVPIIFTTAYSNEEYLVKSLELSIAKYITKPVKIKDLIGEIASIAKVNKLKNVTKTLATQTKKISKEKMQLEQSNQNLNKQLNFKKNLIENFICSFSVDKNGKLTLVSKAFCKVFGYCEDALNDISIPDISVNAGVVQKEILNVLKYKELTTFNATFVTKEKKEISFETTIIPKFDADNLVIGYEFYQIHIP